MATWLQYAEFSLICIRITNGIILTNSWW